MVGQVPCKCEGLASGRRAQGLSTHKSGQGVGRPAAGRTHPARQRLLQGGGQGRPHPHIQGPRSGPSPRRHPPEGTPWGRRGPVCAGGVTRSACPAAAHERHMPRAARAECRPGPPWRNGGGLGAGASPRTPSFRDAPPAHRGPRASPAGAALAGAERPARAAPDTPTPLHEQPPNAAAQTRSRLEAHAGPGPRPPTSLWVEPGALPRPRVAVFLKKRDSSSDPAGHLSLRQTRPGGWGSDSSQTAPCLL